MLRRIKRWQEQHNLTTVRLAAELDIPRGTLVSYLTHMADVDANRPVSASARQFRFARLEPHVQARIAEKLDMPLDNLRTLSMGLPDRSALIREAASAVNRIGSLPGLPEFVDPTALRYAIAQAAGEVEGVGAVSIVSEYRGGRYRFRDQYQIVVFAEPDSEIGVDALRNKINVRLDRLSLPGSWEHGSKQPDATLSAGRDLRPIGSIVCPSIAAPRPAGSGLLLRLRDERVASHRIGVVISGPYAGSIPAGSHLAAALSAGYARFEDLARLANAEMVRSSSDLVGSGRSDGPSPARPVRTALGDREHDVNAGFLGHRTLAAMKSGRVAGAWVTTMEVSPLDVYLPIRDALVELPDLVVVLHYGRSWRRAAAWRLAAADLNTRSQIGDFRPDADPVVRAAAARQRPIWSSDQLQVVAGRPLGRNAEEARVARAVLEHQSVVAAEWFGKICRWGELLNEIEELRSGGGLTISVTLDDLPADSYGLRFDGDRYESHEPPVDDLPSVEGRVVYPDELRHVVDAWIRSAAKVLHAFAALGGRDPADYRGALMCCPARDAYGDLLDEGYRPEVDPLVRIRRPAAEHDG